jgi:hypothetical protein
VVRIWVAVMSSALVLGSVLFSSFEIPEQITFGGKQRLVVHALPGGGRVVDAMGAEDAPVRWSGIFSGANAASRVRTLERMRRSGVQLTLSWDAWLYSAVIQDFEVNAANSWWIPYRIELCTLPLANRLVTDWLNDAVTPVLTVNTPTGAALDVAIAVATVNLASDDLGMIVAAAGELAQYATTTAYNGTTS